MDKVLVMGAGQVLEFDEPYKLLQNPNGFFYGMIRQTGPFNEAQLHNLAKDAHMLRNESEKREDSTQSSPHKEDWDIFTGNRVASFITLYLSSLKTIQNLRLTSSLQDWI